jgi:hypothetical protein
LYKPFLYSLLTLQNKNRDSDSDADCASGLKCFQREAYEHVPGCIGIGNKGTDYCYAPDTLATVGNDGSPAEVFPLGKCEGDW